MRKARAIMILGAFSLAALRSFAQGFGGQETVPAGDTLWDHILVLEDMVSLWPKQEYYLQLADLYGRAGDSKRQLQVYEIAYGMGWLDQTRQFVQMAQLLLRVGKLAEADEALRHALDLEAVKEGREPHDD